MISVVIPLYNKERSIVSTIESVVTQTYKDWELIIVDDGSTDNSLEVVKNFVDGLKIEDRRLKIVSQKNAGVSAARNAGIMAAKGEYVAFLDADDWWEPTYLEVSAKLIEDYPGAGIYGTHHGNMYGDSKQEVPSLYPNHRGEIWNPWLNGSPYWTNSVIIAKRVFQTIPPFDERMSYGEDMDMWYRVMLSYPCVYEDIALSYYRVDSENKLTDKPMPLEKHIPYYIDKYSEARAKNADFRRFFDMQMVYRLYPYMFDERYKKEARKIAHKLDYSQLKMTMRLRLMFPHLYSLFTGK